MTLAEQLEALCKEHDLRCVTLEYYPENGNRAAFFSAVAIPLEKRGGLIGAGSSDVSMLAALTAALHALATKRAADRGAAPELVAAE